MLPGFAHQRAPTGLIRRFQMEDLHRQPGLLADRDRLVDGLHHLTPFTTNMARVDASVLPCAPGDPDQLGWGRVAPRRIDQRPRPSQPPRLPARPPDPPPSPSLFPRPPGPLSSPRPP